MFFKNYLRGALASFFMLTNAQSVPLTIHSLSKIHRFDVEIADTDQKRTTGLMNRHKLSSNQGMVFVFPHKDKHCFWMYQTYIPLDILMINEEGIIVDILFDMRPHSKEIRCSKKSVRRAIELKGGICHDKGIQVGNSILFVDTPK